MAIPSSAATSIEGTSRDLVSLARNGAWVGLGLALAGLFTFSLSVVIARTLGASQTGVFYEAVSVFTVMITVAQLGADIGLLRFIPRHRVQGRYGDVRLDLGIALIPVAAAGVVCAFCLVGLGALLGKQPQPGDIETCLIVLAPMAIPVALSGPVIAATRGFGTPRPYVLIECLAKPGARLICVAVAAAALSAGPAAAILVWGLVGVGTSMAAALSLRALVGDLPNSEGATDSRKQLFGEFWRFTAPRALGSALATTLLWLDLVLLGALRGSTEAGVYSASIRYVSLVTLALGAVVLVVAPQVSGFFAQRQIGRVGEVYRVSTLWVSILSLPIVVVAVVFAPALMSVYGSEFSRGAPVLTILALAMLVNVLAGPCNTILLMGGASGLNLMNLSLAVALNVALNLALIPPYGMVGSAVAWTVAIVVTNVLPVVQIRRRWNILPVSFGLLVVSGLVLGTFGAICVAVRLVYGATFGNMVVATLLASVAYVVGLWQVRGPAKLEAVGEAMNQMRRRIHRGVGR